MQRTYGGALQAARKRAGYRTQEALGDMINRSAKTVRLYETNHHLPEPEIQELLERLLGHFWDEGDEVEAAIRRSNLAPFRQTRVLSVYQEQLHEQAREERAG